MISNPLSSLEKYQTKEKTKIITKLCKSHIVAPDQQNKRVLHVLGTTKPGLCKVYLPPESAVLNFDGIKKTATFYDFLSTNHTILSFYTSAGLVFQHTDPKMMTRWMVVDGHFQCEQLKLEGMAYTPQADEEVMGVTDEIE